MNDSKEIKQYLKNSELDLENIIEDFTPYISKIIDNMAKETLNTDDKEEIASDIFFILWNNREKLDINKYMSSYLAGIARNVVKVYLRKLKNNLDISDYENCLYEFDTINLLDSNLEEINKVEKTISKMKIIDRKIFLDFYYSSKSIRDIAKEQKISESSVKQRLYRIRNKIKKEVR